VIRPLALSALLLACTAERPPLPAPPDLDSLALRVESLARHDRELAAAAAAGCYAGIDRVARRTDGAIVYSCRRVDSLGVRPLPRGTP
jgi:hypothetical protein